MTTNEAMIVQNDSAAHDQAELAAACGGAAELMRPVDTAAEVVRRGRRGRRCPRITTVRSVLYQPNPSPALTVNDCAGRE